MTKLTADSFKEFSNLINQFKKIFTSSVKDLQSIAEDENEPFIKRKLIGMMTSDDEAMSLKSIQWIHELITSSNNLELKLKEPKLAVDTGTFILSKEQNSIYKNLKNQINPELVGDDHLVKVLSINIDNYNNAVQVLNTTGFKMEYKTGAQQIRPEVTVKRDAEKNIIEIMRELCQTSMSLGRSSKPVKPVIKNTLASIVKMQSIK